MVDGVEIKGSGRCVGASSSLVTTFLAHGSWGESMSLPLKDGAWLLAFGDKMQLMQRSLLSTEIDCKLASKTIGPLMNITNVPFKRICMTKEPYPKHHASIVAPLLFPARLSRARLAKSIQILPSRPPAHSKPGNSLKPT